VIGDYARPSVRLPGSGGACEIAILAKRTFVIAPQSKRSFPERVDFITSPAGVSGPAMVVTNLGCYEFVNGEMVLASLHPGCTVEQVRENTGWEIAIAEDLKCTTPPTAEELRIIRGQDLQD
jgi:glutaconate CoA-transferase subunit B